MPGNGNRVCALAPALAQDGDGGRIVCGLFYDLDSATPTLHQSGARRRSAMAYPSRSLVAWGLRQSLAMQVLFFGMFFRLRVRIC